MNIENALYKPTGYNDSLFFLAMGLVLHPIYLILSLPALIYSFKAKDKLKQNKPDKYFENYSRARQLNLINYFLLFAYIAMRVVVLLSYVYQFEIRLPIQWSNSILVSFLVTGLQK